MGTRQNLLVGWKEWTISLLLEISSSIATRWASEQAYKRIERERKKVQSCANPLKRMSIDACIHFCILEFLLVQSPTHNAMHIAEIYLR
jgi:hypothetical protein